MKKAVLLFLISIICYKGESQSLTIELISEKIDSLSEINYAKADSLINLLINEEDQSKNREYFHLIHYKAAELNADEGLFDEAEKHYLKAIEYVNASNRGDITRYQMHLASNYLNKGNLKSAIKYGLDAIETAKEINDSVLMAHSFNNVAESYRYFDQLELSIEYNNKALTIALSYNDEDLFGMVYNNMAAILGEMGENDRAIDTIKKALQLLSDSNFFGRAKFNSNLGFCYRNLEKYELALKHHRIALKYKQKAKMLNAFGYTLGAIGRAYIGMGVHDSALYYTLKEYEHAKEYNNPYQLKDAAIHISDAYYAAGDYERALNYFALGRDLEDSLYQVEVEQQSLLYQRKYDLTEKEREIERLKIERELKDANQKYLLVGLTAMLLIAILLAIIYKLASQRKEQERQIAEIELKNSKKENEQNRIALKEYTKELMQKNKVLKRLNRQLSRKDEELQKFISHSSEEREQLNELKLLTNEDWTRFRRLFEKVYPSFFNRLQASHIDFTKGEKRLMALIKLDMETKEMADTLGISSESVSKSKFRLKRKLNDTNQESIESFVTRL